MTFVTATDRSESARSLFVATYGRAPDLVARAPGRVNLIGEHTDYNAGLCLPMALPHATYVAISPRPDQLVSVVSAQQTEPWTGQADAARGWAGYAAGVVWAVRDEGFDVPGLDIAIDSSVPVGSGLSSSAALECAVAIAISALVGPLPRDLLVRAGVRAESEVVGAPTGGMDQTVAVYAEPGHALLLDFRDGSRVPVLWHPEDLTMLVIDTRVSHALVEGGYAARRADCETACRELGITSLRAGKLEDLTGREEPWARRARHVISEVVRVEDFVLALASADWTSAGRQMNASHLSLRDDYEVSCPELDTVVETALAAGALGARMTGGGFGGCAVALVPDEDLATLTHAVDAAYDERGWGRPAYLTAEPSGPAVLLG